MTPGYALRCACTGACIGCLIIAGFAARTLTAIIKDHRMGDLVRFFDIGAKHVH